MCTRQGRAVDERAVDRTEELECDSGHVSGVYLYQGLRVSKLDNRRRFHVPYVRRDVEKSEDGPRVHFGTQDVNVTKAFREFNLKLYSGQVIGAR